jgi:hypothetical protein
MEFISIKTIFCRNKRRWLWIKSREIERVATLDLSLVVQGFYESSSLRNKIVVLLSSLYLSRSFHTLAVSPISVVEVATDSDQLFRGASTGNTLAIVGDAYVQACAVGFICAPVSHVFVLILGGRET